MVKPMMRNQDKDTLPLASEYSVPDAMKWLMKVSPKDS
jgi:hypothetical protein